MNIYEKWPMTENDDFLIRKPELSDVKDLFKVYSDKNALPFFNSDNCHGDNFYYSTEEIMENTMKYWFYEYDNSGFVRFAIVDKRSNEAIGTIELFLREADDYFERCELLRVDVRSDYEEENSLRSILALITPMAYEWFGCRKVATKAPIYAVERIKALESQGYVKSSKMIVGQDGTVYGDYWEKEVF